MLLSRELSLHLSHHQSSNRHSFQTSATVTQVQQRAEVGDSVGDCNISVGKFLFKNSLNSCELYLKVTDLLHQVSCASPLSFKSVLLDLLSVSSHIHDVKPL